MAWFIDPSKNEGYPMLDVWPPEWQTDYTSSETIRYPDRIWRIEDDINEGYPWIYYWFQKSSSDEGDMEIGGSQTNYPNGFTGSNFGGVDNQFGNDGPMDYNDGMVDTVNQFMATAMLGKMLALNATEYQMVINHLNNPSPGDISKIATLQGMYGANVYDGILLCKMYPFPVSTQDSPNDLLPSIFGQFDLHTTHPTPDEDDEEEHAYYTGVTNVIRRFDMGHIAIDIRQAWEIENISYYIYLPYAGIHTIDIRSNKMLDVRLFVDLFTGVGEYVLRQDGQVTGMYKCNIGIDVPINLSQGIMTANYAGFLNNQISSALGSIGSVAGGLVGGAAGAGISAASGIASNAMNALSSHFNISSPSLGSNIGVGCYPRARIIAKIPTMFNDALGYQQVLGVNRSTTYVHLSDCSGFTQCKNYKCDIIIATEDEKAEIERLMNEGVML